MTELDPTWQRNISKKIASMTKAVFRLHADGMDHRDAASRLKMKYEGELTEIEAASRENLERAQQEANDYHPAIERTVRSEFETKFNQTKIQFDAAHEKLEADSNRVIETATARLNDLKGRVEALRQKAQKSTEVFQQANDEIKQIHADAVKRIEDQKQKEMAMHIDDANAKYEAAVAAAKKKEADLRRKFELDLEDLKKTLASSQVSAVETLNKRQADLEAGVKTLEKQKAELKVMLESFKKMSAEQRLTADEMLKKAEVMQKHIIQVHQKELAEVQASVDGIQKRYTDEIEKIRAEMAQEEQNHQTELQKRRAKLEKEKNRLQKQLADFEAETKKAALASDERYQKLSEDHNNMIAELEAKHAAFLDEAKKKEEQSHEEMIEMQRKHLEQLVEIRNQMEQELDESRARIDEMKKKHNEEIMAIKKEQDEKMNACQEKLKGNAKEAAESVEQLMKNAVQLRDEIEKAKQDQKLQLEEIERKNTNEFAILRKKHSEDMSSLDRCHDLLLKRLELDHTAELERTKKQFVLDTKRVQETSELSLKLDIEAAKNQITEKKAAELDSKREAWDQEISDLQDMIESKTREKKRIEAETQKEVAEKQAKISEMKKELEKLEEGWKEEKQVIINDWNTKFENLTRQFREEERQNEEARRMTVKSYEETLAKLKVELTDAENRKTTELSKINKETEAERKRGEVEISQLKKEAEKLREEHKQSIADLEAKLKIVETMAIQKKEQCEEQRKEDVTALKVELRKVISDGRKSVRDANHNLFVLKQQHERELHEMRMNLEQYQLDSQYEVLEFQRQKQSELEQLEVDQKHEIELMNIELQKIQNETDRLKQLHNEEMQKIQELHDQQRLDQKDEFERQRVKIEEENKRKLEEKQNIINDLEASIQEWESKYANREARPEDCDYIQRLDELLQERQDGIEKLVTLFTNFERELLTHEAMYHKVFSGDVPPVPMNPIADRRLKKDASLKSVGSAKKIPPLVTPVTPRNQ